MSRDPSFLGESHPATTKKAWERPALRRLQAKKALTTRNPSGILDAPPPNPGPDNES
jgi:hypothetical protein